MKKILFYLFLIFGLNTISMAENQKSSDDTFFLRLQGAASAGHFISKNNALDKIGSANKSYLFNLQIGYAFFRKLPIYFNLGSDHYDTEANMIAGFYGLGATYYFGNRSFFLDYSLSLSFLTIRDVSGESDSNISRNYFSGSGVRMHLAIGKEFWLSEYWGIGPALFLVYAHYPGKPSSMPDDFEPTKQSYDIKIGIGVSLVNF